MRLIYSCAIGFYAAAVRVAAISNSKARLLAAGWRGWRSKTPFDRLQGRVAWFHASSLGEFEQARPVMELFRNSHPDFKICLTFFSPSGYEIRKDYNGADLVCYLPPDTRRNARSLVTLMHPDVAFFVKYDFWFNYLKNLSDRHIPTFIFSAIFRPRQYFFRWYGHWFAKQLLCYRHIFVQNTESAKLLENIGISNVSVTGDTRYDRVTAIAANAKPIPAIERFLEHSDNQTIKQSNNLKVLVAGSTWEPDERNIKAFLDRYDKPLRVILAPHMIGEEHLHYIEHLFGKENCIRFSIIEHSSIQAFEHSSILIIDNIGMLSAIYRYATVAYIGGGFGKGIHNILEATAYNIPVCFGPNHHKFQEANDMIAAGAARSYEDTDTLTAILSEWLCDGETYSKACLACRKTMSAAGGSAQSIMDEIEKNIYPQELRRQ
ncbi:MAG: 3-deoxy-D-manno-octulosonic acid transferase [Bacteroidales bacterium]|nr:3-deoxy-D-manno-octulosonic acid transferase [Bacteroidales bacterium]